VLAGSESQVVSLWAVSDEEGEGVDEATLRSAAARRGSKRGTEAGADEIDLAMHNDVEALLTLHTRLARRPWLRTHKPEASWPRPPQRLRPK
jgi:hypothetical protein